MTSFLTNRWFQGIAAVTIIAGLVFALQAGDDTEETTASTEANTDVETVQVTNEETEQTAEDVTTQQRCSTESCTYPERNTECVWASLTCRLPKACLLRQKILLLPCRECPFTSLLPQVAPESTAPLVYLSSHAANIMVLYL